jgi:hypothetical protein
MKLKEEELSNLDGIENFWVDQWNRWLWWTAEGRAPSPRGLVELENETINETETGSKSVQNWLHKSQPFLIGTQTPTTKLFNNCPLRCTSREIVFTQKVSNETEFTRKYLISLCASEISK